MTEEFVEVAERKAHPNFTVPRDGWDRPMVVPSSGGKPKAMARASSYGGVLEDKTNIARWQRRMALVGAAMRPDILEAEFAGLTEEDLDNTEVKQRLNKFGEQFGELAGSAVRSQRGTLLHELSEYVDGNTPLPDDISDQNAALIGSYLLEMLKIDEVVEIEQFCVQEDLGVAGTFDRILKYEGQYYIGDLKTGRDLSYSGISISTQLAIYSRAKRYDFTRFPAPDRRSDKAAWERWKRVEFGAQEATSAYSELVPGHGVNQDWGLVIHLPSTPPEEGPECQIIPVDLAKGWEFALLGQKVTEARRASRKVWGDPI